jgi:uncharacterized protein HemY
MDFQYLFNGLALTFGGVMGWLLKTLWQAVESLRRDVRTLEAAAHEKFVRRDDWQTALERLEQKLDRLFERLDTKADR